MRYVVERDLRNTDLIVTAVRNNYRLKAGQVFLEEDFVKISGIRFTKVGDTLRIVKRGETRKLHKILDPMTPDISGVVERIDEFAETICRAVTEAIIAEAKQLRLDGVVFPRAAITLRQKILERLRTSNVY